MNNAKACTSLPGAASKNLALGCLIGETRGVMHNAMPFDRYWSAQRCPDAETRQHELVDVLPMEQFARAAVTYISGKQLSDRRCWAQRPDLALRTGRFISAISL